MNSVTHLPHEFMPDQPPRPESAVVVVMPRIKRGAVTTIPTMRPIKAPLLLPRRDLAKDAMACADALDELYQRYGKDALVVALRYLLNADGVDTAQQSIDDLAQGSEEL